MYHCVFKWLLWWWRCPSSFLFIPRTLPSPLVAFWLRCRGYLWVLARALCWYVLVRHHSRSELHTSLIYSCLVKVDQDCKHDSLLQIMIRLLLQHKPAQTWPVKSSQKLLIKSQKQHCMLWKVFCSLLKFFHSILTWTLIKKCFCFQKYFLKVGYMLRLIFRTVVWEKQAIMLIW